MAFIEQGGEQESKGAWVEIGKDNGVPVRVRVRVLSEQEERKIRAGYGRPKDVDLTFKSEESGNEGSRVFRQNVYSEEDLRMIQRDIAVAAWTDAENFGVIAKSDDVLKSYRTALQMQDIEVGVEFKLDGKLTQQSKFFLCENRTDLAKAIAQIHNDERKKQSVVEEGLRKN